MKYINLNLMCVATHAPKDAHAFILELIKPPSSLF